MSQHRDKSPHWNNGNSSQPDLLAHKYRPTKDDDFICHRPQASELKTWIEQFLERSDRQERDRNSVKHDERSLLLEDSYDCSMNSSSQVLASCIILAGPPGVGKTSMVYAIADQLKLHVIECHASEKRDSKSISRLKLANQKQHIHRQVSNCSPLTTFLYGAKFMNHQNNEIDLADTSDNDDQRDGSEEDDSCIVVASTKKATSIAGTPSSCKSSRVKLGSRSRKGQKKVGNIAQRSMLDFIQKDSPNKTGQNQDGNAKINDTIFSDELEVVDRVCNVKHNKTPIKKIASPNSNGFFLSSALSSNASTPTKGVLNTSLNAFDSPPPKSLSVSTTSSIILFDDVDVLFEDDGPFWSSLVPFIEASQRPVIMTATQSVDKIKELVLNSKVIYLEKPEQDEFCKILLRVCNQEGFNKNKFLQQHDDSYKQLIYNYQCDIRQCLNQIHFYRGTYGPNSKADPISMFAAFHSLDLNLEVKRRSLSKTNKDLLSLYNSMILSDVLESHFNLVDRKSMVQSWIENKPTSLRSEGYSYNNELGEDIQGTIINLSKKIYQNKLLHSSKHRMCQDLYETMRIRTNRAYELFDLSIKGRVESYEAEFKTDIAPFLALMIRSEQLRQLSNTSVNARRIKRFLHYLDTIQVYLDDKENLAAAITDFGAVSPVAFNIFMDSEAESFATSKNNDGCFDSEDTYEYYNGDSDTEEVPVYNTRKRLKTIDDDDTY